MQALTVKTSAMAVIALMGATDTSAAFRDVSEAFGFAGGSKAAFADYDGDGWVDVYAGGKLYRNDNGKRFIQVKDAGLSGGEGIWGDYDNDGRPDLFDYSGSGALYRNIGDGSFKQVKFDKLPTVNSRGAVWLDIDNDGRLDLYVGGYEVWQKAVHPDVIYRNTGDHKFVEHWRSADNARYSARGVTSGDFDEDGDTDVFVSNYRLQPNFLWRNDGRGKFQNAAKTHGAAGIPNQTITYTGGIRYPICGHTIGSAIGDLDDDGHLDIFVANFSHPPANQDRPEFLRNRGPKHDYKFEGRSVGAGLAWQESFASAALGDYDNDGDLDLYFTTVYAVGSGSIRNYPVLYRNDGGWKFTNVTADQGLAKLGPTYQAAWADIDNDGDLDLCTNGKLFLNEAPPRNWIKLVLEGDGKQVNRSAIGATVRLKIGERVITRHVETGTGEGNQNDITLHFGLGDLESDVTVEIAWPGKVAQRVTGLKVNRLHRIKFERSP